MVVMLSTNRRACPLLVRWMLLAAIIAGPRKVKVQRGRHAGRPVSRRELDRKLREVSVQESGGVADRMELDKRPPLAWCCVSIGQDRREPRLLTARWWDADVDKVLGREHGRVDHTCLKLGESTLELAGPDKMGWTRNGRVSPGGVVLQYDPVATVSEDRIKHSGASREATNLVDRNITGQALEDDGIAWVARVGWRRARVTSVASPTSRSVVAVIVRIGVGPTSMVVAPGIVARVIVVHARPVLGTAGSPTMIIVAACGPPLLVAIVPPRPASRVTIAIPVIIPVSSPARILTETRILFRQIIVGQVIPGKRRPRVSSSSRRQVSAWLITLPAFDHSMILFLFLLFPRTLHHGLQALPCRDR